MRAEQVKCWNFSAVIDSNHSFWVWGILHDAQAKKTLCIKQPELVSKLKIKDIQVGESLAVAIDETTSNAFIIGTNAKGELGLLD